MRADGSNRAASPRAVWLGLLIAFFLLYALTANRGEQWQDSGVHILRIVQGEVLNPRGLALSHPLHHWLGRAAVGLGLLEPAFAVTLVSSLFGAIAVANVVGAVRSLTRSTHAALFAALSFGVAHTVWKLSTIAEAYTITAALLSAECWCLAEVGRSRRGGALVALALFNGLGVANHNLAMLSTPVVAAVACAWCRGRRDGRRIAWLALAAWVVGTGPYAGLVAREWYTSGAFGATMRSALFGTGFAEQVLAVTPGPRQLLMTALFLALNFPNLLAPLAIRGLWTADRSHIPGMVRWGLGATLLIHFGFAARYPVVDQHTFFIGAYVLLAVFGGVGMAGLLAIDSGRRRTRWPAVAWALLVVTPMIYGVVPAAARRAGALAGVERRKPYRDDYVYLFAPWSVMDDSAERMSREAAALAGTQGLIVAEDPMSEAAIRYRLGRAGLGGVELVRPSRGERIDAAAREGRTVVLVPGDREAPATPPPAGRGWTREGDLYVLDVAPPGGK